MGNKKHYSGESFGKGKETQFKISRALSIKIAIRDGKETSTSTGSEEVKRGNQARELDEARTSDTERKILN